MITLRREVVVRRPPEEVFEFLADARNENRWNPNVVRIDKTTDGPVGPGSTFVGTYRRGGRMTFELVEYDRPASLAFTGGRRQLGLAATVRVAPAGDGTAVAMRADLRPRGPLRLLEPILRPLVEHQYRDAIARFRDVVETPGTERNKAIYRRWFDDVVSGRDLALADELLSPDYRLHFPGLPAPLDRDGHKALLAAFHAAFPDWTETVEDVIGEGDRVVIRVTGSGTHRGEFQGIAPTGRRVTATGVGIGRIEQSRIAEAWGAYDALGLLDQLGAAKAA